MVSQTIDTIVIKAIDNAKKSSDGSISRRNGIKILQEIFKADSGLVAMRSSTMERRSGYGGKRVGNNENIGTSGEGYGYGYGYGFGGMLSQTKDLFELYMDRDSEGGEKITQSEQQSIIQTVKNWVNDIKDLNNSIKK